MAKITILGAGITALAVASQLPRGHDITIVARNLPGDPDSTEWASPWAGAVFMGMFDSCDREQQIQLESFWVWWRLALQHPESSVRRVEMQDLIDGCSPEKVWYYNKLPDFRLMSKDELPEGADFGMSYKSIIITPSVYLVWLRKQLEATGVKFMRMSVNSLSELRGMGHDILINATGVGARHLTDVADMHMQEVRGQTILVKSPFHRIWIRRGKDYTYALGRPDGTTILGGIKQYNNTDAMVNDDLRADIFRRIHENLPQDFPSPAPQDFSVVRDIVGIRPQRETGVRIEKEELDGQTVVHAYGAPGGGYIYGWGTATRVVDVVNSIFNVPEESKTRSNL